MTREEAIEVYNNLPNQKIKEAFEVLAPELRDSDDERIRKEIIDHLVREVGLYPGIDRKEHRWLRWLEKQKEPTEEPSTRLNGLMQEYVYAGKDEEEQEHRLKCYQLFWDALGDSEFFKQKEQKPWEWGEEETKILDSIIDDYEKAAKSFCGYDGKIGLLRAIRDGEYDLPKQEWSEEDERMRKAVLDEIEHQIEIMPDADDMDSDDQDRYNKLISMSVWVEDLPKREYTKTSKSCRYEQIH